MSVYTILSTSGQFFIRTVRMNKVIKNVHISLISGGNFILKTNAHMQLDVEQSNSELPLLARTRTEIDPTDFSITGH